MEVIGEGGGRSKEDAMSNSRNFLSPHPIDPKFIMSSRNFEGRFTSKSDVVTGILLRGWDSNTWLTAEMKSRDSRINMTSSVFKSFSPSPSRYPARSIKISK